MHDLGRIVERGLRNKEPLPAPYKSWAERGMLIYPSSVHLFAGAGGTYKTMVTQGAVINMAVPSLVFSTDSDDLTMAARLLSVKTGRPTSDMRLMALRNPREASRILREHYGFIKWAFDSEQDGTGIWNQLYAYATRYGRYPKLIVADILSDMRFVDAESEWASLREAMKQFNIIARETEAAVILVHHVTEGARTNDAFPCPGRAEIMGKDVRHPVLVTTFGKDSRGDLHVACVKNRHGEADALARNSFPMSVDPTTSIVKDWDPHQRRLVAVPTWRGWGEDDDDE